MSQDTWYVRVRGKVTGPYGLDQLKALYRLGRLARFHEVSSDRTEWVTASTLTVLDDGHERPSSQDTQAPPPAWYYQAAGRPVGPVNEQLLLGLIKSGTVSPDTMVWREGLQSWLALRDAPLDPALVTAGPPTAVPKDRPGVRRRVRSLWARHNRRIVALAWAVAGATIGLSLWSLWLSGPLPRPNRHGLLSVFHRPTVIRSVTDSTELAHAVGLVVSGFTVTDYDGTTTDRVISTGTCFAISEDGYLLTNRHVIEEVSKYLNAERKRKDLEEKTGKKIQPRIWVFFKDYKKQATIRYESDEYDLAVLKIETDQPIPVFRLAADDRIDRAAPVYAVGFPAASREPISPEEAIENVARKNKDGVRIDYVMVDKFKDYSITNGVVSLVSLSGRSWKIEHTARIGSGNSGGPLVTSDGTVIGMNTLVVNDPRMPVVTSVAIGAAQFREEIARNVPELSGLASRSNDP
jgi:S1-C subfamily serine protease